jgi:hypothetical protein
MRGVSIIEAMVIDMNAAQDGTLEQVRQVVAGTQALEFRRAEDDQGATSGSNRCCAASITDNSDAPTRGRCGLPCSS